VVLWLFAAMVVLYASFALRRFRVRWTSRVWCCPLMGCPRDFYLHANRHQLRAAALCGDARAAGIRQDFVDGPNLGFVLPLVPPRSRGDEDPQNALPFLIIAPSC